MKRRLAVWLSIMFAVAVTASEGERRSPLEKLDWMVGTWASRGGGVEAEERWTDAGGGLMLGLHRDIFDSSPAFFEYLRIEVDPTGNVDYVASPRGGPPTRFRLTGSANGRAVFSNPAHDYPQRIIYWLENERTLCSRTEGEENGEPRSQQWCWKRRLAISRPSRYPLMPI